MTTVRAQPLSLADRTVIALTTWPASRDAEAFARALVERRVAACVNVLPVMQSHYWWDGAVQGDEERQVVIKTSAARLDDLLASVRELHPYDVPEFLVVEIAAGADSYLDWVKGSVRSGGA